MLRQLNCPIVVECPHPLYVVCLVCICSHKFCNHKQLVHLQFAGRKWLKRLRKRPRRRCVHSPSHAVILFLWKMLKIYVYFVSALNTLRRPSLEPVCVSIATYCVQTPWQDVSHSWESLDLQMATFLSRMPVSRLGLRCRKQREIRGFGGTILPARR
jgi:hypothetical protein